MIVLCIYVLCGGLEVLLFLLAAFFIIVNLKKIINNNSEERNKRNATTKTVAFFHPYCAAGGGGERVLWCAVRMVQEKYPENYIVIYTGDVGVDKETMLNKAKHTFNVQIDHPELIEFVYLYQRKFVEANMYPVATLIGQSLGSIILGLEALLAYQPDVYIDTMGYAFTLPLFKCIGMCKTASYVHYPTISSDMLGVVASRESASVNNSSLVAKSAFLTNMKIYYYKSFAVLYGLSGAFSDAVMVNSTWTYNHINHLWFKSTNKCGYLSIVYPPCNTTTFQKLPLSGKRVKGKIISVAQFRPEKNHRLQLESLKDYFDTYCSEEGTGNRSLTQLVLIGGCRNAGDEARVNDLKQYAIELGVIKETVFKLNLPFEELLHELETATMGIHTMWNEHFGIGIVELLAAGCITVAHDSGGPKTDIIPDSKRGVNGVGFRAALSTEYAAVINDVLNKTNEQQLSSIQDNARAHITDIFSDEAFEKGFYESVKSIMI